MSTTQKKAEVDYYNQKSEERVKWASGEGGVHHAHNDRLSVEIVNEFLKSNIDKMQYNTLADLGCGVGHWSFRIQEFCDCVVSLDFSEAALKSTKKLLNTHKNLAVRADAEYLPIRPNSIDGIIMFDLLQHVDASTVMKQVVKALRPGGWIICSYSNRHFVDWIYKRNVKNSHEIMNLYSLKEMEFIFVEAGLNVEKICFSWIFGNSWIGWFRRLPFVRKLIPYYYNYISYPIEKKIRTKSSFIAERVFRTNFIFARNPRLKNP